MAVSELFRELAQEFLVEASAAKNAQSREALTKAAALSAQGKVAEALEESIRGSALAQGSTKLLENQRALLDEELPSLLQRLSALGIEEPPVEFLTRITSRLAKSKVKRGARLEKAPIQIDRNVTDRERRRLIFTEKQYPVTRARLRLVDDVTKEELGLKEALAEILPNEMGDDSKGYDYCKALVYGNWPAIEPKLKALFSFLSPGDGRETTLPINVSELSRLNFSPSGQDIMTRLSRVESYQGMTVTELLRYTNTSKHIRLKKEVEEVFDPEQLIKENLGPEERYFLAHRLLRSWKFSREDKGFLKATIEKADQAVHDGQFKEKRIAKKLLIKLRYFLSGTNSEQGAFFDMQTESAQMLLSMIAGKSSEQLEELLHVEPD